MSTTAPSDPAATSAPGVDGSLFAEAASAAKRTQKMARGRFVALIALLLSRRWRLPR
jgi:hypothetical protein